MLRFEETKVAKEKFHAAKKKPIQIWEYSYLKINKNKN